jgi:hypothetical protein
LAAERNKFPISEDFEDNLQKSELKNGAAMADNPSHTIMENCARLKNAFNMTKD